MMLLIKDTIQWKRYGRLSTGLQLALLTLLPTRLSITFGIGNLCILALSPRPYLEDNRSNG